MRIEDKYEVLEILGKGGNGVVYKVREIGLNRILAIKETILEDDRAEREWEQEYEILKNCFHPALPVVLDSFRQENRHYLVMEYVEGISLKEVVEKQRGLPWEQAVGFAKSIGEVLLYLHNRSRPVVYGDLKPENILVTKEGEIRLIDFGSAGQERIPEKEPQGCYASPGYAAPEQRRGQAGDRRSDIYSFGAVLHYMLSGEDPCRPPYVRRRLRECDHSIPRVLDRLVCRCLQENPEQRFQNMEQLCSLLAGCGKKERMERRIRHGKQAVGSLLFVAFCGFCYRAVEGYLQGIRWQENEALLPAVLFAVSGILWRICLFFPEERGKYAYRLEKTVWKTDKQGIGLFLLLLCLGIGGFCMRVQASRNTDTLPVSIYSDSGYKLCLRKGEIYPLRGNFRMEIPGECFDAQKVRELTVILSAGEGEEPRMFRMRIRPESGAY